MRLTKFGHACVRLESAATTVVVDPGSFTEPEAVDGIHAVLITHEHPDHYLADHLRRIDAPIFTIAAVAKVIATDAPDVAERVTVVAPGQSWEVGDMAVRAVGEKHAVIHPDLPHFDNSGYLFDVDDTTIFHPGDAITEHPSGPVDVLLAPVCAPWMSVAEGIDFARAVGAPLNIAIHDRIYSDDGLGIIDGHFGRLLGEGREYRRLPDGADL